jgi:hypothetical protein
MSLGRVPAALRRLVRERAGDACEYCRMPGWLSVTSFHIDHIIAGKHGGLSVTENLAWACPLCNARKGTDLTARDPISGRTAPLFHPRRHRWEAHFPWTGARIAGRTPTGRATIRLLELNAPARLAERERLRRLEIPHASGSS